VILGVLTGALAAVLGLWTFAQTDPGGEIIRRIAVSAVDERIAGRVDVDRLRFGGDRLSISSSRSGRSCGGTSTSAGWRFAGPSSSS
jgi:hypothetical protein